MVLVHDVQDIHELALVGMDALDLNIENRIGIHANPVVLLDISGERSLAELLDLLKFGKERLVVYHVVQDIHLLRMTVPAMTADGLVNERRELRVRAHEPATVRDAVRLVVEEARIVLIEVMQRRRLQDVRMDLRDAVDTVAADDGEARHMNHIILDDGERMHLALVLRIALAHIDEPAAVDLVNDHIDARQKRLEHLDRPLLKGLRHDRVIRVRHRVLRDGPRLVPLEPLLIDEDAHELCDTERRMRIVDMDGNLLREVVDVEPRLLVMAHDALHTGGDEEVLLDKAHATPVVGAVVWIEELRDGLDELTVLGLLLALLLCEHAVIGEITIDLRVPEAQRVDRAVMIADDRYIVGHSHDCERILIDDLKRSIVHLLHIGIAVELDIDSLVRFAVLPGKTILEPVIRDLNLVAVDDLLLEEAVLVTDAAAMSRQTMRRH